MKSADAVQVVWIVIGLALFLLMGGGGYLLLIGLFFLVAWIVYKIRGGK